MKNRNIKHIDDWATPDYIYNELNNEFNFLESNNSVLLQ